MTLPNLTAITLREELGVLYVTLARPDARNAMTGAMLAELRAVFAHAEARAELRALVLRGSGGHFCAGADVKELAQARAAQVTPEHDPVVAVNAAFGYLCAEFARLSLPTLCVVEGSVLGGGFGLACSADVTLAAESARFGLPETSLGIVPAQIAPFLVERLGYAQAKRLALLGGKIDARAAFSIGLVHALAADGAPLEQAIAEHVERFLACAPGATRATKQLFLHIRGAATEGVIEHAAQVFARALRSAEGAEGTLAFVQKRAPAWRPPRGTP